VKTFPTLARRTPKKEQSHRAIGYGERGKVFAQLAGGRNTMLYTIAVLLLIAWLLGIVGTYTIGSFIHVLLVVAIVLFLVGLISGRRTIP
jgi:hypothetical protein